MAAKKPNLKVLKKIKMLLLDIDGVLTDGRILWVDGTGWTAMYSVLDGFGIRRMMKAGIDVGFISGGSFTSHKERAKTLKITHAYFGDENKIVPYEKIKSDTGLKDDEFAFIGDELFDIAILEKVGFAATVPHAVQAVKKHADYITKAPGGFGAAREVIEMILAAQGKA
jgi:3-deoxy-D-manno-octulosonate 8-phosphate phosphatase (KDO 8-P phosphatase)